MIHTESPDVPPRAAALTLHEMAEMRDAGMLTVERGDTIFECRHPETNELLARHWIWRDGQVVHDGIFTDVTRVWWIARPDRRN